jgi:hypothetical protein
MKGRERKEKVERRSECTHCQIMSRKKDSKSRNRTKNLAARNHDLPFSHDCANRATGPRRYNNLIFSSRLEYILCDGPPASFPTTPY